MTGRWFRAAALVLVTACRHGREAAIATAADTAGDTLHVAITASESLPGLFVALDTPRVVWTPEELGRPTGMAVGPDGRITVSDVKHLYAWQPGTDTATAVGGEGAGPGEYRSIGGMVAEPDGSLLTLDSRQRRMIRFDAHGTHDSTWPVDQDFAHDPFLAVMQGNPVVLVGPGLVHVGEPPDTLSLKALAGDSATVLGKLRQFIWMQSPSGMLAPRDAYPAQALLAGTATAGFAFSDGLQYDIRWWRPNASPAWLHLSRAWIPPSVSIDREPPTQLLAQLPGGGKTIVDIVKSQTRGDHKYSLGQIVLLPTGTLWTMPIDSSYVYHPWYYAQLSQLRQPTRLWEVFGPDGHLRAQVRLPSMFAPTTVHDCQLYGFLEDSDGAFSVATIPLGKECARLAKGW